MHDPGVDAYLAGLPEPKRSSLQKLRDMIHGIIPQAEECISYNMPGFRIDGKMVAGFAAFKNHLSYFPHSGSVIPELAEDVSGYVTSSGTLQFPIDEPLPRKLVVRLIDVRRRQLGQI